MMTQSERECFQQNHPRMDVGPLDTSCASNGGLIKALPVPDNVGVAEPRYMSVKLHH